MGFTNLRACTLPEVFAVDASPQGAGACVAPVGAAVGRELYRHVETRGFYTRLASSAAAALAPHTSDQDVEETLGLGAAALGAVPRGPRSTSDWDVLAVGAGAGSAAAHCSLAGLSVYGGRYGMAP